MQLPNSLANLGPLLDEVRELRATKSAIEKRLKEIDGPVREALYGLDDVVTHNGHAFKVTMSEGRKTFDKKAAEAAGLDLEPYYKVGAPFTTLKIV